MALCDSAEYGALLLQPRKSGRRARMLLDQAQIPGTQNRLREYNAQHGWSPFEEALDSGSPVLLTSYASASAPPPIVAQFTLCSHKPRCWPRHSFSIALHASAATSTCPFLHALLHARRDISFALPHSHTAPASPSVASSPPSSSAPFVHSSPASSPLAFAYQSLRHLLRGFHSKGHPCSSKHSQTLDAVHSSLHPSHPQPCLPEKRPFTLEAATLAVASSQSQSQPANCRLSLSSSADMHAGSFTSLAMRLSLSTFRRT